MVGFALRVKPHDVCLVPERREERTTEGGLDVVGQFDAGARGLRPLAPPPVSACRCSSRRTRTRSTPRTRRCAGGRDPHRRLRRSRAQRAGADESSSASALRPRMPADWACKVNAGHGLHYHNVQPIAAIPQIAELNIGHAIVAHALFVGWVEAVREMKRLMVAARGSRRRDPRASAPTWSRSRAWRGCSSVTVIVSHGASWAISNGTGFAPRRVLSATSPAASPPRRPSPRRWAPACALRRRSRGSVSPTMRSAAAAAT